MFFILPTFFFLGDVTWIWGVESLTGVTVKGMSPGLENRAQLNHRPAQVGWQPGEGVPGRPGSSCLLSCYCAPGAVHNPIAALRWASCMAGLSGVPMGCTGNESAEAGWDLLESTRCPAKDSSMG